MRIFCGYFDSTQSDVREYNEHDFARLLTASLTDGVSEEGALQVSPVAGSMAVQIGYGHAILDSRVCAVIDDGGGALQLVVGVAGSAPRIDRVVLRLDHGANTVTPLVLAGQPGSNPQPPAIVRSGSTYDICLASLRIEPGTVEIAANKITDERGNEAVCGYVTAKGLRRSDLSRVHRHDNATSSRDGFLSKEDKAKLDSSVTQGLKPTDSPTFAGLTINGNSAISGTLTVNGVIQGARFE